MKTNSSDSNSIEAQIDNAKVIAFLLGMPGAGKGTQAQLLSQNGWAHINVGGLVRAEVAAGTRVGRFAAGIMASGDLLPSSAILALMLEKMRDLQAPIVIDGYPRRLHEAQTLQLLRGAEMVQVLIYCKISRSQALTRLASRLICSGCGWVPSEGTLHECQIAGSSLVRRSDDRIYSVVSHRIDLFESQTLPLISHLEQEGLLAVINASASQNDVHQQILGAIDQRLGQQ